MDVIDYSQNGEQHEILHVFDALGITKGHLIDLGAGDGRTMSNTRALLNSGWTGDLYDGDPRGACDVEKLFIRTGSVASIARPCDFLNIDLDGNDYHILLQFLQRQKPSLIVAEINPMFQHGDIVVMPYNADHVWAGDTYYGMSFGACEQLGKQFGYTLMHLHAGINAFLLRDDHAKAFPELIRPIEYRQKFDHKPHPPGKTWQRL